jgi:hypothetical protein
MMYPDESTPCLAAFAPPRLFNFYATTDAAEADLARANANLLAPPHGYTITTYGTYKAQERAYCLADPLTQIDEETFWQHLQVLPPLHHRSGGGFHTFLMAEFQQSTYTMMCASLDRRYGGVVYACRMVDATDPATWVTPDELATLCTTSP